MSAPSRPNGVLRGRVLIFTGIARAEVGTIEVPPPCSDDLRLRVLACGLCRLDVHIFRGRVARPFPCVAGHEPVGIVEAVGAAVAGFEIGDRVTAIGEASLAEFCLVKAKYARRISTVATPAWSLGEPVACALIACRLVRPAASALVVVNGVGFMGQLLLQALAHTTRASLVAVDVSAERLALARRVPVALTLVADEFTPERLTEAFGRLADVVFEASGVEGTVWPATRAVRNGGTLALFGHHFAVEPQAVDEWHRRGIAVLNTVPWASPDLGRDFQDAVAMLNAGVFDLSALISHRVPLEDTVAVLELADAGSPGYLKGVVLPARPDDPRPAAPAPGLRDGGRP